MKYSSTGSIRSLARNYISQHRFKEALVIANKALAIGEGMIETQKLLFDVNMELGNYSEAQKNLNFLTNRKDFDYLIRISKWNDHLGDLKTATPLECFHGDFQVTVKWLTPCFRKIPEIEVCATLYPPTKI